MPKIKLTVTESRCRSGIHNKGQVFIIEDAICPPMCMELWHYAYPYIWVLLNSGELDHGDEKSKSFDIKCPDGGRVRLHGEIIRD